MVGAKLPFVLSDWDGFLSGAAWFENGKTIVFGLVGGYFGVELAKWSLDIRMKTGDSFAVPVAVAVAIGRLACFVGGCCYGSVTTVPWGVDFGDGLRRHPTQLYEFVFHLGSAVGLSWLGGRHLLAGQLIKLYIIGYLVYRFFTEYIRPEPILWGGLTGYQLAAAALVPIFVMLWWQDSWRLRETDQPAIGAGVPTEVT
jgi:phosphatidylglycerol:prolipoprotein diacylglycerol transferase